MYAVKMPHIHRYRPSPLKTSVGAFFADRLDDEVERDPERSVRAERNRAERVAGAELPDAGQQLSDAAVGERQRRDHGQQPATGASLAADQAGVDQAEHERRPGERGEPQRPRVRWRPASGTARGWIRRRCKVRLAGANVGSFHVAPPGWVLSCQPRRFDPELVHRKRESPNGAARGVSGGWRAVSGAAWPPPGGICRAARRYLPRRPGGSTPPAGGIYPAGPAAPARLRGRGPGPSRPGRHSPQRELSRTFRHPS